MRRVVIIGIGISALIAAGLGIAAPAAGAKADCTIKGTAADDN